MNITILNENFILTPEKALFWPAQSLIAVADLHLGREATFQKRGLWLPSGTEQTDMATLELLVQKYSAKHIVFLGDLIHSKTGAVQDVFARIIQLQENSGARLYPVGGNHDRHLAKIWNSYFTDNSMQDDFRFDQFIFTHEPPSKKLKDVFYWCGHLHPRVVLDGGGESIRLPTFIVESRIGILPAFSSLAAGHTFVRKVGRRRYACLPDKVIDV